MAAARRSGSTARAAAWSAARAAQGRAGAGLLSMTEPCDLDRRRGAPPDRPEEARADGTAGQAASPASRRWTTRSTPWSRATSTAPASAAKAADAAVARGDDLPPLHGLPIGIKDLQETAGLRTTYGSPIFRDHVPAADERLVAAVRAGRRDRRRQDQHAGIRRRRQHAQRGLWRDRQSVRSDAALPPAPPAARRSRWPPAWCRSAPAPTPAARCAIPPRSAASSASARRRAWSPTSGAGLAGATCSVAGPDGAHRAGSLPAALRHGQRRCARSAGDHGARPHDPPAGGFRRAGAHRSVAPARRAHAGFRLRAHRAAHRRGVRREDRPVPPRLRPRRGHHAGLHRRRRGVRGAARRRRSSPAISEKVRTRPQDVGPNVRANVEEGLRYTADRRRAGAGAADRAVSPLAGVLPGLGRDPDAVDHHQPAAVARAVSRPRSTASRRGPISTGWRWPMR